MSDQEFDAISERLRLAKEALDELHDMTPAQRTATVLNWALEFAGSEVRYESYLARERDGWAALRRLRADKSRCAGCGESPAERTGWGAVMRRTVRHPNGNAYCVACWPLPENAS